MKFLVLFALSTLVVIEAHEVIQGFHFHTYFFQNNAEESRRIQEVRDLVHKEIVSGRMGSCVMESLHKEPIGPHPIGMFNTCCNVSSVGTGVSFFMQYRGSLSVLLHPLTKSEYIDHTERPFWLGQSLPLDVSDLPHERHEVDHCGHYYNTTVI